MRKMKFNNPETQAIWDSYDKQMKSPEIVAMYREEYRQSCRVFWRFTVPLIIIVSIVAGVSCLAVNAWLFHVSVNELLINCALPWLGLAIGAGFILRPRDFNQT